ncbi:MAG: hypothetical protein ACRDHP_05700 [Ktedonobacterales bacterium]
MPESTDTYDFTVAGTPEIRVRNRAGALTIERGATGQVAVRVTKRTHGRGFGQATETDLAGIVVTVTQQENTIRIEAERNDLAGLLKNYQVDIAVMTPAETNLDLRMNAGNVDLRDLTGVLACTINAGNLDAARLTLTGSSSCAINAGNLSLEGAIAPGAALAVEVNAGILRLRLPRDTPAHLDARTDVGSIDIDGWPVSISRRIVQQQASGPLGAHPQGTLRLRVNTGSISLRAI